MLRKEHAKHATALVYTTRILVSHAPYRDSRVVFVAAGAHGLLGSAVEVGSCDWSPRVVARSGEAPLRRVPRRR